MSTSTLYANAAIAIRAHICATIASLTAEAASTRATASEAIRASILEGADQSHPAYPLLALLATDVRLGLNDNDFPAISVSDDASKAVRAASRAGLLELDGGAIKTGSMFWYGDMSGWISAGSASLPFQAAKEAYTKLVDYCLLQNIEL